MAAECLQESGSLQFETLAIVAATPQAIALGHQLQAAFPNAHLWINPKDSENSSISASTEAYELPLRDWVREHWHKFDGWIFVAATGIAVRLISPCLKGKHQDPGIVAIDDQGTFAVSLCSGHVGGGDRLAREVAAVLDAVPIVSSASNGLGLPAVDTLGDAYGWAKGTGDWLGVASAIVRSMSSTDTSPSGTSEISSVIAVYQRCGSALWRKGLPEQHPFVFPAGDSQCESDTVTANLWISDQVPPSFETPFACWHPRTLWVGVGCERGTAASTIAKAIQSSCKQAGLAIAAIAGLVSLDLKQDEAGLLELAKQRGWPLQFYTAEELKEIPVPNPSGTVFASVGTPSVAEASALLAAEATELLVEKSVTRESEAGACTVAIARSTESYSSRSGQISLVGMGPGSLDQLTPAARRAIVQSDVTIGYQLYLDLLAPLFSPATIPLASPITQEVQRADRAIALANQGLSIAVVSSGDCGIYGMGGLVLERLALQGWDGQSPHVEVFPGITALQAAAAKVGAPLMHDFCAISLSDLLTPWEVIETRLAAAAAADFVVALYNPRSRTRTQGIVTAHQIFQNHRAPSTPVAIVKSAYRPPEAMILTTLADLDVEQVDMVSIVLIGNSSTFFHAGKVITPRGYQR